MHFDDADLPQAFPATRISVLEAIRSPEPDVCRAASFGALLAVYWTPV